MPLKADKLRCIFCNTAGLDAFAVHTVCGNCGHEYVEFNGTKFLGSFSTDDSLGLFEVASKISAITDPEKVRKNRRNAEEKLREEFATFRISTSEHVNHGVGSAEMAKSSRLREWAAFELLAEDLDFSGKLCLDNGAGLGGDSVRLIERGAEVVCLDFNPISVSHGAIIVPEAQWFGGNSTCLPFVDNTFDFTVANAALHHMNDVPAAINEMIRVTKPGGQILLVSDPFMRSVKHPDEKLKSELVIFDKHPMVLNGVNEGIIPFNDYISAIRAEQSPVFLTMRIGKNFKPTYWSNSDQDIALLQASSGNISTKFKVNGGVSDSPLREREDIPTAAFFRVLGNPRETVNFLLPFLPEAEFDCFPFEAQSKFRLMNGWHTVQDYTNDWRSGYNRVRLFFSRESILEIREILVLLTPEAAAVPLSIYCFVNGQPISSTGSSAEHVVNLALDRTDLFGARNVVEIGIDDDKANKGAIWGEYDKKRTISVRVRR